MSLIKSSLCKRRDWARIGFYGSIASVALWAFVLEPFLFLRTDYVARLPHLPEGCEGVKVAVASDWHVGSEHMSRKRAMRIARKIAASKPDLILLPGDFVAHGFFMDTFRPGELAPSLTPLSKAAPTFAVLGNHDHVDTGPAEVTEAFKRVGVTTLVNASEVVSLRAGKCQLRVVGIADDYVGASSVSMATAGAGKGEVKIGLTHSPTIYPKAHDAVDVLFAGHTHGGAVCVPGTKWCISRINKAWGSSWVKGIYQPEGYHAPMLVTNGIGNSIIALRFSAPPGFEVVRLQPGVHRPPSTNRSFRLVEGKGNFRTWAGS